MLVKVEYAGKIVGEPKKLEKSPKKALDLALTATLTCSTVNPAELDELSRTPLVGKFRMAVHAFDRVRCACLINCTMDGNGSYM